MPFKWEIGEGEIVSRQGNTRHRWGCVCGFVCWGVKWSEAYLHFDNSSLLPDQAPCQLVIFSSQERKSPLGEIWSSQSRSLSIPIVNSPTLYMKFRCPFYRSREPRVTRHERKTSNVECKDEAKPQNEAWKNFFASPIKLEKQNENLSLSSGT